MSAADRLAAALADRYRIERELGQGGMATVYLAEDLRHDRKVAIKVLRPELAAVIGAGRFLTEIKTTANLQHPHILPLFDSGEVDGTVFYVMPFVEGESLRDRLQREHQLPIADALRIATEVASALDYAHRHNVIHRDIKPENILLHDGQALVADFGIALAVSRSDGGTRLTETGMSLGTPHYMSPEQAMGEREITARTDIYALGCVLYEMLVGEPPFSGPTAQAIIARVMTEEPRSLTGQRRSIPEGVEGAVFTALEKLPADRFGSAAEFAAALTGEGVATRQRARATHAAAGRGWWSRLGWPVAASLLAVVAVVGWLRRPAPAQTSVQRVLLWKRSSGALLDAGLANVQSQATIAPDGTAIVFSDSVGPTSQLFLKQRDQVGATPIAGTEGAMSPFFSPDGKWVAYFKGNGELRKIPLSGGGSVLLATGASSTTSTGAWLDDNTIVYVAESYGVRRVPAEGGTPVVVWTEPKDERLDPNALWALPGSRGVLLTTCPGNCAIASSIYLLDLRTDSIRMLVRDAAGAWYAPTGQLLYTSRDGGLFAASFDLGKLAVTSGAVPVLPGVVPGSFTLSRSGDALYRPVRQANLSSQLVWVARDGSTQPFDSTWQADFEYPALAPDGKTLAVGVRGARTGIWVRRPDGSRWEVSLGDQGTWRPAWRPDGRAFSFVTTQGAARPATSDSGGGIYESPADGGTPPRRMLATGTALWEAEYSHDGVWQLFRYDQGGSQLPVLAARRLEGDTAIRPLLSDGHFNTQLALSPDERWLAYTSDLSGHSEVYVASFPDMKVRRIVSQGGGTEPRWAHSGRELFFKSHGDLMSLPVYPGAAFTPGIPHALFSVSGYAAAINRQQYDVSPDDRRFLMIRQPHDTATAEAVFTENFLGALRRSLAQ